MRNAILMLLFAGMAFGASAAGSWFLQAKMQKTAGDEGAAPPLGLSSGLVDGDDPDVAKSSSADLPVAVRPRPPSVDEVLRFGMGLNKREKHLNEREVSLNQEQSRLQLALADIRGEQQQVEGLQAKLQGQAEICQSVLEKIQLAREQLAAERENAKKEINKFEDVRIESDQQEQQNIKQMSEWFRAMEPEKAAGVLKELTNDGKTDLAVKLLSNFEERDAAKILSALDDYALMVELTERFKDYQRPPRKEARR